MHKNQWILHFAQVDENFYCFISIKKVRLLEKKLHNVEQESTGHDTNVICSLKMYIEKIIDRLSINYRLKYRGHNVTVWN